MLCSVLKVLSYCKVHIFDTAYISYLCINHIVKTFDNDIVKSRAYLEYHQNKLSQEMDTMIKISIKLKENNVVMIM